MIYNLVHCSSNILHTKLETFDFESPPINPQELVVNLVETMMQNNGLGLAANQVGLPYRVFVMAGNPPIAMFNPRIIDSTTEQVLLEEGCLSYPLLFVKIKRSKSIKVRYQDFDGIMHTEKYTGMTARIIQHELDHLNGVDYTSRANRFHLDKATRKQKIVTRKNRSSEAAAI